MPASPPADTELDVTRVTQAGLIALNNTARKLTLRPVRIRAAMNGAHLSAFKGIGMELEEVRPYQPGDDLYSIDWRVTARTGEAHTKVFREERERPVLLWVDYRQSMFFGTRRCFKSVLAARTAALLAWMTVQHGDRVGGLVFAAQQHDEIRPLRGNKGALHLIHALSQHPAWRTHAGQQATQHKPDALNTALQRLHHLSRPGSLLFLISDFYDFDDAAAEALSAACRQHDVVMIHISDPMERQLPAQGYYRFTDGDTELGLHTGNRHLLQQFQQRFAQRQQQLQNLCKQLRLQYLPLSTDDDWPGCLQQHIGWRTGGRA